MPDKANNRKKEANKPAPAKKTNNMEMKEGNSFGIVELLIFIILAGVIFIFIFGMKQMQEEQRNLKRYYLILPLLVMPQKIIKRMIHLLPGPQCWKKLLTPLKLILLNLSSRFKKMEL